MTHKWYLGSLLCDIWTSFDVICCTASILHLVAISLDRYWVVTQIDYVCHRSAKRILIMIALSWSLAIIISVPPLFGWKPPLADPNQTGKCLISQDLGYTVFSTLGAFYLPLISMMIIYYKVYAAAKSRIRKKAFRKKKTTTTTTEDVSLKVRLRELTNVANKDLDARSDTSSPAIRKNQKASESTMMMMTSLTAVGYAATETTTTTVVIAAAAANSHVKAYVKQSDDSDSANSSFKFGRVENVGQEQRFRKPATNRRDLEIPILPENGNESNKTAGGCPTYLKSVRPTHRRAHLKHLSSLSSTTETCTNFDSVESNNEDTCHSSVNHYKTQTSSESTATVALGSVESPQSSSLPRKFPSRNLTLTGLGKSSSKSTLTREQRTKEKIEQKRERKAARTLAIVTGTFIICWLPFFIVATVRPFCHEPQCRYPTLVTSIIGWLGYINSLLNPVIYTIFNPDFRAAFHKILFKRCFRCRKF